jgi:hypothetical protein
MVKPKKGAGAQPKKKSPFQRPSVANKYPSGLIWKWAPLVLLGISALVFAQARIRLLAIPLERDEGSFAYIGHWLFRGRELYADMLDSKLPGLYTVYAFFTTIFGYDATGVHMGLFLANTVSAICLFLLVRKLFDSFTASIATSFYLALAISLNMTGFAAHATQLLTPFVLGSFLLFWTGLSSDRKYLFFLSGLLMGIAFTIKQQSVVYGLLLAVIWWPARKLWYKKENSSLPWTEWIWLGVGGLLPLAVIVGYFGMTGKLEDFYNWTYVQPMRLAGSFRESRFTMFLNILPRVFKQFEGIWAIAALGLVAIFFSGFKRASAWFGLSMALLGVGSVVIGAAYYPHYFVMAIPGIALLAASTLRWGSQKAGPWGPALGLSIAAILLVLSIKGRTSYYFDPDYARIHYATYSLNMFPELEKIGQELAKRVPEGQKIGILGSEPQVLVTAGRESCSKYLMVYAMLIDPELSPPMQQEYMQELKECMPEYIVWNTASASWAPGYEKLQFFKELMAWVEANYTGIGVAESQGAKPGIILWDEAARKHKATSVYKVIVLQKKSGVH